MKSCNHVLSLSYPSPTFSSLVSCLPPILVDCSVSLTLSRLITFLFDKLNFSCSVGRLIPIVEHPRSAFVLISVGRYCSLWSRFLLCVSNVMILLNENVHSPAWATHLPVKGPGARGKRSTPLVAGLDGEDSVTTILGLKGLFHTMNLGKKNVSWIYTGCR